MKDQRFNPSKALLVIQYLSLFVICGLIFFIIFSMPMTADDFVYSQKTATLSQFIQGIGQSYLKIGGRIIVWTIARLFLMQDGLILWRIVNSLFIILTLTIVSAYAKGMRLIGFLLSLKKDKGNISLILVSFMLAIFIDYSMKNQVFYWAVGSVFYLWPNLAMLIFIFGLLFNKKKLTHSNDNSSGIIGWTVFSFIMGLSIEVVSAVCTSTLFVILVYNIWRKRKLLKDCVREIAMFSASFIGSGILYLAPGNLNRLLKANTIVPGSISIYGYFKHNFISAYGVAILDNYLIFSFSMILCFFISMKLDWSRAKNRIATIVSSLLCSLLFLVSGYLDNSLLSPLTQERFGNFVYVYMIINFFMFIISFIILSIITVKMYKKTKSSLPLLLFLLSYYSLFVTIVLPAEAPRVFSTFLLLFMAYLMSILNLVLNKVRLFPNLLIAVISLSLWAETAIGFIEVKRVTDKRMSLVSELKPEDKMLILPKYNKRFIGGANFPLPGDPRLRDFKKYYSVPKSVIVTTDEPPFDKDIIPESQ